MAKKLGLDIKEVDIDNINPAKYNPRDISQESFEGLCHSISRFGLPEPLVVNKATDVLVSGHQRLKAVKHLGWKTVPVVYVNLTETEEKALNVAMNNPKIQGFFTDELQSLLNQVQTALPDDFESLRLDDLVSSESWESDIEQLEKIVESDETMPAVIRVTCSQEMRDEVLDYLKDKLADSSFEDVQIE